MAKSNKANTAEAPKSQRRGPQPKENVTNSTSILQESTQQTDEIVTPFNIINQAAVMENFTKPQHAFQDLEHEVNDLSEEDAEALRKETRRSERLPDDLGPGVTRREAAQTRQQAPGVEYADDQNVRSAGRVRVNLTEEDLAPIPAAIPQIRKVVLRKLNRYEFRLGMEKVQNEQLNLVPGVGHTFVPDMKGNEYVTGFDSRPEERTRLEKMLRVNLSATSSYWANLTFRMEDKPHGQILNFDDPVMGGKNEVIYFAMLGSSIIANGYEEYRNGNKPNAEWFIEDREAEAEYTQQQMTHEIEATNVFQEISAHKKRGIAKLLGLQAWGTSDKVVSADLWKFIKAPGDDKKITGANAKRFLELTRIHDTELNVSVLVKDCMQLNILRKGRGGEFMVGDVALGASAEKVVSKLSLPQYADVREALQNQLRNKNR